MARRVGPDSGMPMHADDDQTRRKVIPRGRPATTLAGMLASGAATYDHWLAAHYPQQRPAAPRPRDEDGSGPPHLDGKPSADAWTGTPTPDEALQMLQALRSDTGDRRALEAARTLSSLIHARQRAADSSGELRCRWCHDPITRTTVMGPAPEYCSDAHRKAAARARLREQQAAEAKYGPSPGYHGLHELPSGVPSRVVDQNQDRTGQHER